MPGRLEQHIDRCIEDTDKRDESLQALKNAIQEAQPSEILLARACNGMTLLDVACSMPDNKNLSIQLLEILLNNKEARSLINYQDKEGHTILRDFAREPKLYKYLLEQGAILSLILKDRDKDTPLFVSPTRSPFHHAFTYCILNLIQSTNYPNYSSETEQGETQPVKQRAIEIVGSLDGKDGVRKTIVDFFKENEERKPRDGYPDKGKSLSSMIKQIIEEEKKKQNEDERLFNDEELEHLKNNVLPEVQANEQKVKEEKDAKKAELERFISSMKRPAESISKVLPLPSQARDRTGSDISDTSNTSKESLRTITAKEIGESAKKKQRKIEPRGGVVVPSSSEYQKEGTSEEQPLLSRVDRQEQSDLPALPRPTLRQWASNLLNGRPAGFVPLPQALKAR